MMALPVVFIWGDDSAEIIRFPTAKHEIANSEDDILELYWSSVFDFFENQLKKIKN